MSNPATAADKPDEPVELVDTHCHIQSAGLEGGGERVTRELWAKAPDLSGAGMVEVAAAAGVTRLLCVGCDLEDSRLAIEFVRSYQESSRQDGSQQDGSRQGAAVCRASAGIHPHEAKQYAGQADKLKEFAALAEASEVAAIGECGFDFYYNHSPKEAQAEVLRFQIELARRLDKPMIFHVREAFDDFWPVFDSYEGIRGVLHSFTDSAVNLAKGLERGLYVGVNGIATFAKDPAQLAVYKSVPLERLLLETDAPFLTPTPYRGTINEPKRLGAVADFLADLRGENRRELAETTTRNARALFGL